MGFLDKAKEVAKQAQDKLEEVQSDFNERQKTKAAEQSGEQGSAPAEGSPAAEAQPPSAEPAPPPPPPEGEGKAADPFKPISE
jgi:hypothetical protein